MAHKVAKFSNGFEDVYKGNRDVKAAWMITNKETGEVLASGHSLDRFKAEKTAQTYIRYLGEDVGIKEGFFLTNIKHPTIEFIRDSVKRFRAAGLLKDYPVGQLKLRKLYDAGVKEARDYNDVLRGKILSKVRIEIVDI